MAKSRKERFSAYVFDLDGTLVDMPVDWSEVRKELSAITEDSWLGVSIFSRLASLRSTESSLASRVAAVLDSHEARAAARARPIQGASGLISLASARGKLALVTMQGKRACDSILWRLGMGRSFRVVVTREDSLERREQLKLASRALEADPSSLVFVGDKENDVAAAREVGVAVASVGPNARSEWAADFYSPTLEGLRPFLWKNGGVPAAENAGLGSRKRRS